MSKSRPSKTAKPPQQRKPSLAPRIFAILALLIILAMALAMFLPAGGLR